MRFRWTPMYEPNDGAAGGTAGAAGAAGAGTTGGAAGAAGATGTENTQTGNATGTNGGEAKVFTQAEVDQIVQARLAREKSAGEAQAEKVRKDAEQAALVQQGEYKTLAEQRATEIEQLKQSVAGLDPVKAKAERYEALITAQLTEAKKNLPAHITPLLDKMDPIEQLEYIQKNREALTTTERRPGGGTPRTPLTPPATPNGQEQQARPPKVRL